MTSEDFGWVVGFLEGEGSFRRAKDGTLSVHAGQVNKEPLDRLQSLLGGSVYPASAEYQRKRGVKASDSWTWVIRSGEAAKLMLSSYKLLSNKRKEQVRVALGVDGIIIEALILASEGKL